MIFSWLDAGMERSFPRTALFVTSGLLIWAADFLFIYVFAALACARGYADVAVFGIGIVPFASGVASALAFTATCAIMAAARRGRKGQDGDDRGFRARLAAGVAILGLIAVAMTALPGFLVAGTCA